MIEVAAWTACISASSGTSETAGVVEAGTGSAEVTVGLGGPAVAWALISRGRGTPRLSAFFLFAIFLAGAITATFHAGGEQGWWALPATCLGVTGPIDTTNILAQLEVGHSGPSCADIPWSWLGLSMAGWNAVISAMLAGFSLAAAARPRDAQAPRLYNEP